MKTLLALLLLIQLSVSLNAKADHETNIDLDGFSFSNFGVLPHVYNKSTTSLPSDKYLWLVYFEDGTERKYKAKGSMCEPYTECDWIIFTKKKGVTAISTDAH